MDAAAAQPVHGMRVTRTADGVELYFPPLRAPGVAAATAAFGVACLVPSLFATAALAPAHGADTPGMLSLILVGAFTVPFLVFGVVFIALAVYMLANSLTVNVTASAIRTTRSLFGMRLARRELRHAEIAAIEPEISAKYQSLFAAEPRYRLVARAAARGSPRLIVAEGLVGERAMEQVRSLIAGNAGLQDANR